MKLLVATDFPPDAPGGGPAVVRQMLSGFGGQVFWWSCRQSPPPASRVPPCPVMEHVHASPGRLFPQKRWTRWKARAMRVFWAPYATHSLASFLHKVSPDCIWAIPHDWSIFPLYGALLSKTPNPFHLHATIQDFPDIHHHDTDWGSKITSTLVGQQEALYAYAGSADATSLPMLDFLQRRTGKEGAQMLHAGLESEDFHFLETLDTRPPSTGPIRIAYAGTILAECEFSFFAQLLERIRALGVDVRLEFWSTHTYSARPWFRSEWMHEHGHLPQADLVARLRQCSWGFIPMSLADHDPRYNRFSFPTKFITYLAAGLPILSLGHPESSLMKMTKAFQVGLQFLKADLSEAPSWAVKIASAESRFKYTPEILRCAQSHFDARKMRAELWRCFTPPRPSQSLP